VAELELAAWDGIAIATPPAVIAAASAIAAPVVFFMILLVFGDRVEVRDGHSKSA
jgi:hypothetical protein